MIVLLVDLPTRLLATYRGNSKGLEKRAFPSATRIQNSVESQLHDVLRDHPNQVISPHKADDSPGKRRHEPALATHEYRSDLGRDNCKEQLGAWVWSLPEGASCASHE